MRLIDADALKEDVEDFFVDSLALIDSIEERIDKIPTTVCVLDKTIKVPTNQNWTVTHLVDVSTDSIEAIADAVVKKLRGEQDGN